MGAIDPLLGIVHMKKASGLLLVSNEVPTLLTDDTRTPLTMPPLSSSMLDDLLQSVLGPDERALLARSGRVEAMYQSEQHGPYSVEASAADGRITLMLREGMVARSAPPPPPRETVDGPPTAGVIGSGAPSGDLSSLLDQAIERRASDVLLSADAPPLLRVDGALVELPAAPMTDAGLLGACGPFLSAVQRQHLETAGSVDFAVVHPSRRGGDGQRFRANLFRHERGLALALRAIWAEVPSLDELHLPGVLTELMRPRTGLVLVTGATGSGKSTTLAALLEQVNRTRACHIVTLEDPIEYLYPRRRAVIHQREVGRHVDSFASGLRAALRENPDIILLGEMRDPETIRLAITAAETGHLVLSTLHSGGAVMAIERIVDVFAEGAKLLVRAQLAGVLRQVVAQQLVPAARGGVLPALEILTVTHAVAAQIREGRTHMLGTQMEIGAEQGMIPMERALADLVRTGRITRAAGIAAAPSPEGLDRLLDDRSTTRR